MARFVSSQPIAQAPEELLLQATALMASIWPKAGLNVASVVSARQHVERVRAGGGIMFSILEGDRLIAHAKVGERDMVLPDGILHVGCLAGVCVDPEFRGQDLGRQIVRTAFDLVDRGQVPVMLFQTAVPGFYEKLGAREVSNTFFNGTDPALRHERPWWEAHVMSYPAKFAWPDAPIDLNGSAF